MVYNKLSIHMYHYIENYIENKVSDILRITGFKPIEGKEA